MINVDMSNVWGQVSLPELLALENEVASAHAALSGDCERAKWLDLPCREPNAEIQKIWEAAQQIRSDSQVCVVVGIGGCSLSSQAALALLQGPHRNLTCSGLQMLYTGHSLSTRHWNQLMQLLEGKDFSVIVLSRSGTTTEPAIAFRALRWMLERKYGTDQAARRIYAVAGQPDSALAQMAKEAHWQSFSIPAGVSEPFSALTPAGLLPMSVAGIDILEVLNGAADAVEAYALRSYENPVWQYAAIRNLLYRGGKAVELLGSGEPGFRMFGAWWQQLFAQAEGKESKGLFPAAVEFPADLYTLGQLIQQGPRNLFQTVVRFDPPQQKHTIGSDWKDWDELNYLEGKNLDYVEESAFLSALSAHVDGGVPVITMDCGELNPRTVGELFYFLELSCGISAHILGVDPNHQPGLEPYTQNLFRLLGKPGLEE